jgi:hypothetical protein
MTDNYDNWHDPNDDSFSNKRDKSGPQDKGSSREERSKDQGDRPETRGGRRER